jgi:hypothetical protein
MEPPARAGCRVDAVRRLEPRASRLPDHCTGRRRRAPCSRRTCGDPADRAAADLRIRRDRLGAASHVAAPPQPLQPSPAHDVHRRRRAGNRGHRDGIHRRPLRVRQAAGRIGDLGMASILGRGRCRRARHRAAAARRHRRGAAAQLPQPRHARRDLPADGPGRGGNLAHLQRPGRRPVPPRLSAVPPAHMGGATKWADRGDHRRWPCAARRRGGHPPSLARSALPHSPSPPCTSA